MELHDRKKCFQAGAVKYCIRNWYNLTQNWEGLETVTGLPVLLQNKLLTNNINQLKRPFFLHEEINILLNKGVIVECYHNESEFIFFVSLVIIN